ncbi:UvrD-helicase domain-containing protein [Blattabacterium cuenoti]|uniref:UvrD-helicase domain-containing protein n=1 Tax=Blattabacterium cuenoti TaxID=1653831 RepID=UPI00163CAB8F|nr:UvrD-helicase domain-containing protein [Blattabacterium cuenoti]
MLEPGTLKIYPASAGSGKTSFLIINYLYVLFNSKDPYEFKKILVLTFTRKSSEDMKTRILNCLHDFSVGKIQKSSYPMFQYLINLNKEYVLTKEKLFYHSKKILNEIFHDFSSFSNNISTLDKFTYRIVRTFLSRKKCSLEMNTHHFIQQVVKNILQKLKISEKWSKILIQFSLEKFQRGQSWNIIKDLQQMIFLLMDENQYFFIKKIENFSFTNFITLKDILTKRIRFFEKKCELQGILFYNFIREQSINENSFIYSDLPRLFDNMKMKKLLVNPFTKRLEKNMKNGVIFSKKYLNNKKNGGFQQKEKIISLYEKTKKFYQKHIQCYLIDKVCKRHLWIFSMIHEIKKECSFLKKERNILLHSELNQILYEKITHFIPKIYETFGMKYQYYFIDEFQDISYLQWENIKILLENSLSENGSSIIVGDAKQSIYRWRGGSVKQFIHLMDSKSKFYKKDIVRLSTNFRSFKEIVQFNNTFYQYFSEVFQNTPYKKIYENVGQNISKKIGGYVEINFFHKMFLKKENYQEYIYHKIINKINKFLLHNQYSLSDIALLVRTNEECNFLCERLMEDEFLVHDPGTVLIKNHIEIQIIINVFEILSHPFSYEKRFSLISLLLKNKFFIRKKNLHNFIETCIFLPLNLFLDKILSKNSITLEKIYNKSIYQISEIIIESFNLFHLNNASCLYSFLDVVYRNEQKNMANSIADFLYHWDSIKDKENIVFSSKNKKNMINVMTIHKSKGLQFPIVIIPFTDWNIFSKKKEGKWIHVDPIFYQGLEYVYIEMKSNFHKNIRNHEKIKHIYNDYILDIILDNINLLYVATTRPIEQLILFSKLENKPSISHYIKNFLNKKNLWNNKKHQYSFGKEF